MEKTPWHIWVVGVLALLWNAGGAWNYVAVELRLDVVINDLTAQQLAFFEAIPSWAIATWAVAVWGSVLGSILILMRRASAAPVMLISFIAMGLTSVQNFFLSNVSMGDIMGPGAATFTAIIVIVAVLLVWYSYTQKRLGRLR